MYKKIQNNQKINKGLIKYTINAMKYNESSKI